MGTVDLLSAVSFACLVALRDGSTRLNNEGLNITGRPQGTINLMLEAALSSVSCQWPDSSSLIKELCLIREVWERLR